MTSRGGACSACGEAPKLRERYVLLEVLGDGASGTTYRAVDAQTGETVAIKELAFHRVDSFRGTDLND